MPMHTQVAGVWKLVDKLHTRISTGAWKEVIVGYVRVSGVWKKFHELCLGGDTDIGGFGGDSTLRHNTVMPENAQVGGKWDPDGGVYDYESTTTPSTSFPGTRNKGTWIGGCANTEYEGRWIVIVGDPSDLPQSFEPAENVWRAMNLAGGVRVEWDTNGPSIDEGTLEFQLRRISDNVVVLTDRFDFDVEAEDPMPK